MPKHQSYRFRNQRYHLWGEHEENMRRTWVRRCVLFVQLCLRFLLWWRVTARQRLDVSTVWRCRWFKKHEPEDELDPVTRHIHADGSASTARRVYRLLLGRFTWSNDAMTIVSCVLNNSILEKLTKQQHKDRKVSLRFLSSPFSFHRSQSTNIMSNTRGSVTRGENADRGSAFTITTMPPPIRRSRKPGLHLQGGRTHYNVRATGPPQAPGSSCVYQGSQTKCAVGHVSVQVVQTNKPTNKETFLKM